MRTDQGLQRLSLIGHVGREEMKCLRPVARIELRPGGLDPLALVGVCPSKEALDEAGSIPLHHSLSKAGRIAPLTKTLRAVPVGHAALE